MAAWQIWLIFAGICFIIEIATVGFLIFWLAIAALITSFLSLFITNIIAQTVIFVLLSIVLIALTRPFANRITKKDTSITNANAIIGKNGIVTKQINTISGDAGQVKVSGDVWTAIIQDYDKPIPVGSTVKVLQIDGVKLIVEPISLNEFNK